MAVSSPSATPPGLIHKLDILIDSLLDGAVVPFVGAGISGNARPRPGLEDYDPRTWALSQKMSDALKPVMSNAGLHLQERFKLIEDRRTLPGELKKRLNRQLDFPSYGERAKAHLEDLRFAEYAELLAWTQGYVALCEALQIHRMTELEPLPAHFYLAMLAREGLTRQIITTNYDTCIETAHTRTFGAEAPSASASGATDRHAPCAVITTLEEYRQNAGFLNTGGERRPRLQLLKINGCASAYKKAKVEASGDPQDRAFQRAAERIILTERQLQDFRDRKWARDLLKDTARTRVLLFSGFGSDEPQVRHTMLLLAEEFEREDDPAIPLRAWTEEDVAKLPNAPFINGFGPTLSFNQFQVMHGFAEANLPTELPTPARLRRINEYVELRTCTGKDAPTLNAYEWQEQLPADDFFARVYQRTWGKLLLQRYASQRSPFALWLGHAIHGSNPAEECTSLLRWLYPDLEDEPQRHPGRYPFGRFPAILELTTDWVQTRISRSRVPITEPAPLWQWLHALHLKNHTEHNRAPYPCLKQDSLFIVSILYLLFQLFGDLPGALPGRVPMRRKVHSTEGDTVIGEDDAPITGWGIPWWRWIHVRPCDQGLLVFIPTPETADQLLNANLYSAQALRSFRREPRQGLALHLIAEDTQTGSTTSQGADPLFQVRIPSHSSGRAVGSVTFSQSQSEGRQQHRPVSVQSVPLPKLLEQLWRYRRTLGPPLDPDCTPSDEVIKQCHERLIDRVRIIRECFAATPLRTNTRLIPLTPATRGNSYA